MGKGLTLRLQAELPSRKPLIKKNYGTRQMITCYVGLSQKEALKLQKLASDRGVTESAVLRQIIAWYLGQNRKIRHKHQPLQKTSPNARKVKPRTLSLEQDQALRKLADQTGRSMSELIREAVERYVP